MTTTVTLEEKLEKLLNILRSMESVSGFLVESTALCWRRLRMKPCRIRLSP